MVALMLLALTFGAITLGSKMAVLVKRGHGGEIVGGIAGLLILFLLVGIMFWLGVVPKTVLTAELNCPWLRGC